MKRDVRQSQVSLDKGRCIISSIKPTTLLNKVHHILLRNGRNDFTGCRLCNAQCDKYTQQHTVGTYNADRECKRELVRSYIKKQATVQYKTPYILHTYEYTDVFKLFTETSTNIQENYSHILAVFILQSEICVTFLHSLVQFV